MDIIAELNSVIYSDDTSNKIVLIGDLNCRLGTLRQKFVKENSNTQYQLLSDTTEAPNENAKILAGVLKPLTLVNGLSGENFKFDHHFT